MLYLIVRFNFILRLSVTLLHESKDLCRSLRSPVFSLYESGSAGYPQECSAEEQGSTTLEGTGESTHSLVFGRYEVPRDSDVHKWCVKGRWRGGRCDPRGAIFTYLRVITSGSFGGPVGHVPYPRAVHPLHSPRCRPDGSVFVR